jgi:hypothetical protein
VRSDLPPGLPEGRYDAPSRRQRIGVGVLSAVVALAALAGAYALYSRHQAGRLDAELTGYVVQSDSLVRITFSVVTRGHAGECKVQARDRSGTISSSKVVAITPTGGRTQVETVDLPTQARAVTGELVGCRRL